MMNSRALSVGARRPGRGSEGMAMCTSKALGACELGYAGEGLGGRIRRCACRRGYRGPLGVERGSGGLRACPHDEFQGSECGCEGAREGLGRHGCVYE